MRLATAKLSDKESRAEVDKVFQSFDINRAGKFTTLELKKVAQDLGEDLTDEEIQNIFTKADLDDDGFVTGDDFYNIMTHKVYWEQWDDMIYLIDINLINRLYSLNFPRYTITE